ncbi:rRNA maturation RNase YbeY [Patescibacteria group bacterium]|nr:rRNA maturation RNase YbeY [Patescibacteria group bacterium]
MPLALENTTRTQPPRLPYRALVSKTLGEYYDLTLVFVGDTRSRTLNKTYRGKDVPASVLSFPLEDGVGEIYLALPVARRRALRYGGSTRTAVAHYLIHGMLHLKGYVHGSTMDGYETEIARSFGITLPPATESPVD